MTDFCETLGTWGAACGSMQDFARPEARLALLDKFGCMIIGWDAPQTLSARNAFTGEQTSSATALILGTAAHPLDFDDYEVSGSTHPSAAIYGALLGLSRIAPKPKCCLLDAYLVGFEAIVGLGEILRYAHYNASWHATGTIGTVGAAAASVIDLPAPFTLSK